MARNWNQFTISQEDWELSSTTIREYKDTLSHLGGKPEESIKAIDILNSKTGLELDTLSIHDKITIIMEASKLNSKKNIAELVHEKYL